jgi:DNA-binding NtrC family response regulator
MGVEDQPIRSIIVDDDKSIGDILKELVSSKQVSVEVFSDGHEALEFIRKQPVDVVITDLMMPNVGGLEVLSLAKTMNPDSIVIIITGHGTLETAIEAVREGAYDYIKKPFNLDEFQIAFDNAVEKIRLMRKNKECLQELKAACDQLIAIKQEYSEYEKESMVTQQKRARLNFFSNNHPSFEFLRKANEDQQRLFERLRHISRLKKDGLLTEREFKALKTHIIKGLEMFSNH